MKEHSLTLKTLLSLSLALVFLSSTHAETPPNIILIYADDLGYGDLGCYGATKVKTPNIDKLAAEGRRFTDAHSASAVCTPSRYALISGAYPIRAKNHKGVSGPCAPRSELLIDTEKETIASVLKKKGYATACIGKWHLGFGKGNLNWNTPLRPGPIDIGFDYYFGMPVVNSSPPYVYVENDRIVGFESDDPIRELPRGSTSEKIFPMPKLPDGASTRSPNRFEGGKKAHELFVEEEVAAKFTEQAVNWIKKEKENPFFLYFATTHIHHPFTPAKRFQGSSEIGLYGDFIHELDWMVGELTKTLEENGLSENTLIIFTSDNGGMFNEGGQDAFAAGHHINGDLLGFKFGVWEGGHRVPFIAKWPGKIPAGTTSKDFISSIDMLATFAALTGQTLNTDQQADSVNVLPALTAQEEGFDRGSLILTPFKMQSHLGLRKGKWMFIDAQNEGGFGGVKPGGHGFAGAAAATFVGRVNSDVTNGKINKDAPPAQLYDLEADPNQTKNVYHDHPEVVKELRTELTRIIEENKKRHQEYLRKNPPTPKPAKKGKPVKPAGGKNSLMKMTPSAGAVSLFNGSTLSNWTPKKGDEAYWSVQDGDIRGGDLRNNVKGNRWLISDKSYENFELTFSVKFTDGGGPGLKNSGIQIRSWETKNSVMGYQIDAGPTHDKHLINGGLGYWGNIWDEHRRGGIVTAINQDQLMKSVKQYDGWNQYKIVANGPSIKTWINGILAHHYIEENPRIAADGIIALQAHSGGKFLVHFKDLMIKELPATAGSPKWADEDTIKERMVKPRPQTKKKPVKTPVK